jgi:hypothetical protein
MNNKSTRKIYKKTLTSFFLSLMIFASAGVFAVQNKLNYERMQMEGLALENVYRIHEVVSGKFQQTKALAALVIYGDGVVDNFYEVASVISADIPALANFLLAPGGIVTDVYPLEGNESVLGLDFFNEFDHAGNAEAILARDTGELVMAGPFLLRQGIIGLVGRYPVYFDTETEKNKLWGLVSVSLKFPEALDDSGLSLLEHQGFSYKLWRINPDTGERQVILSNGDLSGNYIERSIMIHNAEWHLRISPIRLWYEHPESWLLIFAGLCISFLIAVLMQHNITLKAVKYDLQNLTGTLNKMAIKFIAERNQPFDDLMTEEIGFIAEVVDIDELSVWRNTEKSDGRYASQIYRWEKRLGGTVTPLDEYADISYAKYIPNWEHILSSNEVINGPVCSMPEREAAELKANQFTSVLAVPVFIEGVFWGGVLFADNFKERYFENHHVKFMRAAAFLFANAVIHEELEKEIAETNEFNSILYENAPIGINTFDKACNFIDYNSQILDILSASGKDEYEFLDVYSPEYQPDGIKSTVKAHEYMKRTMNGEKLIFEWFFKSENGEIFPCEMTTTRAKHKGENIGLCYIYDLRHVKSMENVITQLKSDLTESKVSIMLSQIKPHFLYNALTAIAQLCEENPAKAKKATIDFSIYLRRNMESLEQEGLIRFEKELEHVKSYLDLETAIYGDGIEVIYDIKTDDFLLPPLTVQPIVENAVKHGIGKKEGGGTIIISVAQKDNNFIITVTDNGAGFEVCAPKSESVGINNVRRRLKLQCGGMLETDSEIGKGTTVLIKIPKGET